MKKIIFVLAAAMLMQSCMSRTGRSAMSGASMGAMFGRAMGGLVGGHRGHELGTVIGMIAGAATGVAMANAEQKRYDDYVSNYNNGTKRKTKAGKRVETAPSTSRNDGGYYGNGGSYGSGQTYGNSGNYGQANGGSVSYSQNGGVGHGALSAASSPLVLRNLRFVDDGGNQTVNRNEDCKIVFELANTSGSDQYDVVPYVYELTGNKHIYISPSTRIEVVKAGDVVRYTCTVRADKKLSAGTLTFRIAVSYGDSDFVTLRDFSLPCAK